jgi:hypothetical protein
MYLFVSLCTPMHTCMYVCVCARACVCTHVGFWPSTYACMCGTTYLYAHINLQMCAYLSIYLSVCNAMNVCITNSRYNIACVDVHVICFDIIVCICVYSVCGSNEEVIRIVECESYKRSVQADRTGLFALEPYIDQAEGFTVMKPAAWSKVSGTV